MSASAAAVAVESELRARALETSLEKLGDLDLLALLIGRRGRRSALSAAASLLEAAGGLLGVSRLGAPALQASGLSSAAAARVVVAIELGRRAAERSITERRAPMENLERVRRWAHPRLAALEHEEVWLLSLDAKNQLRNARRVAQGGLHGCALMARDVLASALRDAASAMVLVHNHPSGDPAASSEDIHMTRALAAAADVVGVPLLDHVIVARSGATSLLELGVLDR